MLLTHDLKLKEIAELMHSATYITVMTGAGMSVESGIPPFRGTGGLWTKYGTPRMDGYSQFRKDPSAWWHRRINENIDAHIMELREALLKAKPHKGHRSLALLEHWLGKVGHNSKYRWP